MLAQVIAGWRVDDRRQPLPPKCLDYFRRYGVPEDIIADLAACSFSDWLTVGPLSFIPMPDFIEETSGITACIEHGYLPVAGGDTGDPVVVDVRTRQMLFVSHDELWDSKPFHECLHPMPYRYDEFWHAVVSDKTFPADYYEAQRRWPVSS